MRLGIIGFGRRTSVMLGAIRKVAPCTLSAVADPRHDEIRRTMDEFDKGTAFYEHADELIHAGGLDGIMIGTRCSSHADMALKAMPSNLPIFLEKPVATNLEDLLRLKKGAETFGSGRVLVSFPLRMTPMAALVKEIVNSGTIGTVEHVQAVTNITYGSVYFKKWYRDEAETGGLFLQKATHDFDVINYLVGLRPTTVCAMGSKQIFKGNKPVGLHCKDCKEASECPDSELPGEQCCFAVDTGNEDSASALIRYESGMHVSYSQNFFVRRGAGNRSIRLIGYKGTIEFEWQSDTVRVILHHSPVVQTHKLAYTMEPHFGGDRVLAKHFTEMIRGSCAPRATLEDGMLSALMCLKAKQSSEQNRYMDIDWDKIGMDTK